MDTDALAKAVGEIMRDRHITLAVAESCTGGLLASHITNIPGSSDYFEGGVVSYSYSAKERVLNVAANVLARHGAVSAETAIAMAQGVRHLFQADLALAVTGIAGPGGGTPSKPVGLVYIALSSAQDEVCREHLWAGDRMQNRELSVRTALQLLQEHLAPAEPAKAGRGTISRHNSILGQPVAVEARFDKQGHPTPLAFEWQGQWLPVVSLQRARMAGDERAERHFYMVCAAGETMFELCFEPGTMLWRIVQLGAEHGLA